MQISREPCLLITLGIRLCADSFKSISKLPQLDYRFEFPLITFLHNLEGLSVPSRSNSFKLFEALRLIET